MSFKKYIVLVIVTVALGAGAYVSDKSFLASQAAPAESPEAKPTEKSIENEAAFQTRPQSPAPKSAPVTAAMPAPNVTLLVGSTTYPAYAAQNSTVLDVMREIASTTTFSFIGREYPSLGFFVESINGKKGADGRYWILYVNGKEASKGASQTFLTAGDTVEWKYEAGN